MLVVIFGAGASFDSDPRRTPHDSGLTPPPNHAHRPPLANELFEMTGDVHKEVAAEFPRAWGALMRCSQDVRAGLGIEAALQAMQDQSSDDPDLRAQLTAVRFYLQRVLTRTPHLWHEEAVGQTAYVSLLDQLRAWSRVVNQPLCLITFNYDVLLERAVEAVFGHEITTFEGYTAHRNVHVFKPHGSVNWSYRFPFDTYDSGERLKRGDDARRLIINSDPEDATVNSDASELVWRAPNDQPLEAGGQGQTMAYLPAMAIPVERKPGLVMPEELRQAMIQDLQQATSVITIGWRAAEQHFLDVLQKNLPKGLGLHVVTKGSDAAKATATALWETGRFTKYTLHDRGFAPFARWEISRYPDDVAKRTSALQDSVGTVGRLLRGQVKPVESNPAFDQIVHRQEQLDTERAPYQLF
ncbi:hypothetical protein [Kineococcus sp. R86509]|uniref:hypothetical protein n=1 Tax=Kineococcus sp. R86509 TaxID=3093851 RepID=UPI0036D2B1D3